MIIEGTPSRPEGPWLGGRADGRPQDGPRFSGRPKDDLLVLRGGSSRCRGGRRRRDQLEQKLSLVGQKLLGEVEDQRDGLGRRGEIGEGELVGRRDLHG